MSWMATSLRDRFDSLRTAHQAASRGGTKAALGDPAVYELDKLTKPARAALARFREAWQDELTTMRILDPACGSGAFLIEAFDQLHATYQESNERLLELRGHYSLFDVDKRILENNIYGVDLNDEAIEIARLSLWIKTAERGKALTSLDHPIRVGNSVVADPAVHPKAFDWQAAFPEVFEQGGFDVVIGNPPYVRQEWLSEFKPYLQSAYKAYHGMADLYVYFYELGINVLKPGGLLSFIVTNKWMKAGYGEPLRRFFGEHAWVESVVDFGHAKQIFEDADVFPSILVARKPTKAPKPKKARLCTIPRDQLRVDDLSRQIDSEGVELPLAQLGAASWQLESGRVLAIMAKLKARGTPLKTFIGSKAIYGLKTGCNKAFFVDTSIRDTLVALDPRCENLFTRYLRGQDVDRWASNWDHEWLIALKSSADVRWPWSESSDPEKIFKLTYPSVFEHMKSNEAALRKRKTTCRYWWELGGYSSWDAFAKPKLLYQEIQFHPSYAIDTEGFVSNNKTFVLPVGDLFVLTVLNSPLMWWHNWRFLPHMKDEALSPVAFQMESLSIAEPTDSIREEITAGASRLVTITEGRHETNRSLLDWLRVQHAIEKPSLKLQSPVSLDSDAFVAEVKRIRGKKNPLSAAALKSLRDEHSRSIEPARVQAAEALKLEHTLSDLVNEAYGLTPDEVALMWETAPPRMPFTHATP